MGERKREKRENLMIWKEGNEALRLPEERRREGNEASGKGKEWIKGEVRRRKKQNILRRERERGREQGGRGHERCVWDIGRRERNIQIDGQLDRNKGKMRQIGKQIDSGVDGWIDRNKEREIKRERERVKLIQSSDKKKLSKL